MTSGKVPDRRRSRWHGPDRVGRKHGPARARRGGDSRREASRAGGQARASGRQSTRQAAAQSQPCRTRFEPGCGRAAAASAALQLQLCTGLRLQQVGCHSDADRMQQRCTCVAKACQAAHGGGLHLVRHVGVGLAVEQQPHHLEVAVLRGLVESREAVLPRGARARAR